jgi:hypothetical protein
LRSTAVEGLEWLAANPSPESGVNVAFRSAWESYVEAADALNELGTGSGIMTDQEYADRSRDAWGVAAGRNISLWRPSLRWSHLPNIPGTLEAAPTAS